MQTLTCYVCVLCRTLIAGSKSARPGIVIPAEVCLTRDPIEHVSNADNGVYSTTSLGGARDTAWIATPSRLYHPTLTRVRCN